MTLSHGELFAGISGFGLGFERAGIVTRWAVEIDPQCRRVLAAHHPDALIHDDVCTAGAHNLPAVDIISFGSPCQDMSVAGKRAGLDGKRSNLFYEAVRIVDELRPAIAVWENVPGAFSSNHGRDFGAVLDALADIGAVDIAWRVLDSQYFGVAQRRRRVFLVADFGGERASEILALSDGLSGHPAPRRETGQGAPIGTGDGASISGAVSSKWAKGTGGPAGDECYNLVQTVAGTLGSNGQGGFRTTDLDQMGAFIPIQNATRGKDQNGVGIADAGEPMYTLDGASHHAVAFNWQNAGNEGYAFTNRGIDSDGRAERLRAASHGALPMVAFTQNQNGDVLTGDVMHAISTNQNASGRNSAKVHSHMAVRRLTPRECERLQGFPDDHTLIDGMSDSARYRMLGNAVTVNVAEFIGRRIVAAAARGA